MKRSNKLHALVIMAKNPDKGKVKTRLAADVGEEKALQVYKALLTHTSDITSSLAEATRFVFYGERIDRGDMFDNNVFRKYVQCNGDLGTRMDYAFSIPFKNEFKKVVIIGADCAELTTAHLSEAFEQLDSHDFVIGPAKDGGYYLLGMKRWNRWILESKPWSTKKLLAVTLKDMRDHNATCFMLPELPDIDTLDDLQNSPLNTLTQQ